MAKKPQIQVVITGDASQLERSLQGAVGTAGKFEQGIGQRMTATGRTMSRAITPAAAGIAFAFKKSFDEVHGGIKALRVGTGATGDGLRDLEDSMKSVARVSTQGVSEIGETMAELSTRTGLVGEDLEDLSKKFLELDRIGMSAGVPEITRLFGDWSIATEDQSDAMDRLFRLSQTTGVELNTLATQMVQFGSPLRTLGFDFETTASMLAKFEQEGVNLQTIMPGFRMALKNFALAGMEPAEALEATIESLKDAATESERTGEAFEWFGVRAGADMAAAVREGRFEFDDLIEAMNNGTDTISAAAEETLTLSDRFDMVKNSIMLTLGPFGEVGAIAFGTIAAIGPLVFGLGTLVTALKGVQFASIATAAAMRALPLAVLAKGLSDVTVAGDIEWADGFAGGIQRVASFLGAPEFIHRAKKAETTLGELGRDGFGAAIAKANEFALVAMSMGEDVDGAVEKAGNGVKRFGRLTDEELSDWSIGVVASLGAGSDAIKELAEDTELSVDKIKEAFRSLIDEQVDYRKNWKDVSEAAGDDTDDLVQFISDKLGIEAPRALAILADSSDKDIKRLVRQMKNWAREAGRTERVVTPAMENQGDAIGNLSGDADSAAGNLQKLISKLATLAQQQLIDIRISENAGDWGPPGALGGGSGSAARMAKAAMDAVPGNQWVSSAYRPGAITASGNRSHHADAANPAQDIVGPNLMGIARYIVANHGSQVRELIYTPLGFSIKNGSIIPPVATAAHYSHVHVAESGLVANRPLLSLIGESTKARAGGGEIVTPAALMRKIVREEGGGDITINQHFHGPTDPRAVRRATELVLDNHARKEAAHHRSRR